MGADFGGGSGLVLKSVGSILGDEKSVITVAFVVILSFDFENELLLGFGIEFKDLT